MIQTDLHNAFELIRAAHQMWIFDEDQSSIRTRHLWHIRALQRVRFIERTYEWTGTGIEKDPEILSGIAESGASLHRLHGPVLREGIERLFLVDLGRCLTPGDEEIVEFQHTFIDAEGSFEPFLGQTCTLMNSTIDLTVTLPSSLAKNPFRTERTGFRGQIVHREQLAAKSISPDLSELRITVDKPKRGFNYAIEWARTSS